jgi:chemotaxis protein MotB
MKFGPPQEAAESGIPEYMVSYADMLTIMLAFFIVLFATSGATDSGSKGEKAGAGESKQAGKGGSQPGDPRPERATDGSTEFVGDFSAGNSGGELVGDQGITRGGAETDQQTVFESLRARFGPEWTISNCWKGGPSQLRNAMIPAARGGSGVDNTGRAIWGRRGNDDIKARAPRPGDSALLGGRIHFREFDAALTDAEKKKLDRAADEIRGKAQRIEVRGHASRRPLPKDSAFRDSWDLAYARSKAVGEYLVSRAIDPKRIRLTAAGDNEPIESADEPIPVRHNSRVEVHLLNEIVDNPNGLRENDLPKGRKDADAPEAKTAISPEPRGATQP